MPEDMSVYFSGEKLYGDDFSLDRIEQWFDDEKEGYADLGAKNRDNYQYYYHELNFRHGYSHLGSRKFGHALGLGSAYGDEFKPIIKNIERITILDPSPTFADSDNISGVPCQYLKPSIDGAMPFENSSFDLIACLGVMHHIPNVSRVVKECYRCLKPGGVMLVREPIVSMGDWTKTRRGLTRRERGIPLAIFRRIIKDSGFTATSEALCYFPALPRLSAKLNISAYNNATVVWLDDILSRLFSWNTKYHRTNLISRLGPTSVFYVLEKT